MKILLVNNHTEHLDAMLKSLVGNEVEIQNYNPGIKFHDAGKDLVILSGGGGEGLEITDKVAKSKLLYDDEMKFVRSTKVPVLGICMGFEVIVNAFGGKIFYQPKLVHGFRTAQLTDSGRKLFNQKALKQVESHYWYVPEVPEKDLDVLARSSDTGAIEMIRYKHEDKKILGMQFHPEEGGTLQLSSLLANQLFY
jgi:anthranilate/para-aminobenzoate synthase component II